MKVILILRYFLPAVLLFVCSAGFSQGIRKNFTEMTQSEKTALSDAYWTLGGIDGTAPGVFTNIYLHHDAAFCEIHFNNLVGGGPCPPGNRINQDVFLPWHRQAAYEWESEMQTLYDFITIPQWDWTVNRSVNDPMWTDFLNEFDTPGGWGDWNLNRNLGGASGLPTTMNVNSLLTRSDFADFTTRFENNEHAWPHIWTGGVMAGGSSPNDPVFFFHHTMVDKIWQDWEDIYGTSGFAKTDMPRYPNVNPNDLTDTRSRGVFYAENQLAVLDNYMVQNNNPYKPAGSAENFVYQYNIEAGNSFHVPNGNSAAIRSCSRIVLQPGFRAHSGSSFMAAIDADCDFSTSGKSGFVAATSAPESQGPDMDELSGHSDESKTAISENYQVRAYPNPFTKFFTIEYDIPVDGIILILVSDVFGKEIDRLVDNKHKEAGIHRVQFDASGLSAGIYFCTIRAGQYSETKKMIKVE